MCSTYMFFPQYTCAQSIYLINIHGSQGKPYLKNPNYIITFFVHFVLNEPVFRPGSSIVRHFIVAIERTLHHSFISLSILNQVFVQTEYRMKVCVVWVLFPVLLCVVIQRNGGNHCKPSVSFHRSVCLCFCVCLAAVSHTNQFLLAMRLHLRFGVCVGVRACGFEMCTRVCVW